MICRYVKQKFNVLTSCRQPGSAFFISCKKNLTIVRYVLKQDFSLDRNGFLYKRFSYQCHVLMTFGISQDPLSSLTLFIVIASVLIMKHSSA